MNRLLLAIASILSWMGTALAQAPPPIPPIADTDRVQSYSITANTAQVAIGFPVFGDCFDIKVTIAGVIQPSWSGLWNCASLSGTALSLKPLPITDMVVNFTPALTSGTLVIAGAWRPRALVQPTAPGINRREFNQSTSTLVASQRELFYQVNALFAAGVTPLSSSLDTSFSSSRGSILYRGATAWVALAPGTSGRVLSTNGAAADPSWIAVTGTGTVTNVASGTGLVGGPITTTGTLSLATAVAGTIKSNLTAGPAVPIDNTTTAILDSSFSATQGTILYRGAATWLGLAPGTAGQKLSSGGAAANPSWSSSILPPTEATLGGVFSSNASAGNFATGISTAGNVIYAPGTIGPVPSMTVPSNLTGSSAVPLNNSPSAINDAAFSTTQGTILYRGAGIWTALNPGTAGQVLATGGSNANPSWSTVTGTGTVTSVASGTGITGGPITTAGTLSLATIAAGTVLSNNTAAAAVPSANSESSMLDASFSSTQGATLFRGAGAWQALGPGLSGQVMTANGANTNPSWNSSSARVLLNTMTASASASLQDTTSLTSTYSEYDIVIDNLLPATDNTSCEIQIHKAGVYPATSYLSAGFQANTAGSTSYSSTTFIPCSRLSESANTGPGLSGTIHINNPSNTTRPKLMTGLVGYSSNTGSLQSAHFTGYWNGGNAAVDGFQIFYSAGNITSGVVKVYGYN